ncbi:MAG: hypothetical protein ACMXYL_05705 [Candidatus Woesearchaeota archaeon]
MARDEKSIIAGSITASIMKVTKDKSSYNLVVLERKDSGSIILRPSDIPRVILALNKSYEYLTVLEQKGNIRSELLLKE